ncbi:MAG: glycerate kinase [Actinomycetota bacterium]
MHVVIAPDSFKGSLPAHEVAEALASGFADEWPEAEVTTLPLSDGGDGFVDALVRARRGEIHSHTVTGPLGEPVDARFGYLPSDATAVVEMAQASGLHLLPPASRDPLRATSRGTGELMVAALDEGARSILVGIGGSATNDGGAGMATALGARLLDTSGEDVRPGGAALIDLARVDTEGLDPRLSEVEVLVASDVDNPLLGPRGASAVYGPQKGASPRDVTLLDGALARYADVIEDAFGTDLREEPGAGAAGGLGFGLMAFCGARLVSGIDLVLDTVGADDLFARADLIVTGEGRVDDQTLSGKVPHGVARRARAVGAPVIVVGGRVELDDDMLELFRAEGIAGVVSTMDAFTDETVALDPEATVRRLVRTGRELAERLAAGA